MQYRYFIFNFVVVMQRCYYLSMEYYMGRSLTNAMVNLGIETSVEEAIYEVRVGMYWLRGEEEEVIKGSGIAGKSCPLLQPWLWHMQVAIPSLLICSLLP